MSDNYLQKRRGVYLDPNRLYNILKHIDIIKNDATSIPTDDLFDDLQKCSGPPAFSRVLKKMKISIGSDELRVEYDFKEVENTWGNGGVVMHSTTLTYNDVPVLTGTHKVTYTSLVDDSSCEDLDHEDETILIMKNDIAQAVFDSIDSQAL